jgi:hypothetical protein
VAQWHHKGAIAAVSHFKMQNRNPSTATTRRYGAIKNEMHSNQTLVRPSSMKNLHNLPHASLRKAIFDDLSQAMSMSTPNLHSQPGSFLPSLSESTKSNTSGSFPSITNVSRRTFSTAKEESKSAPGLFNERREQLLDLEGKPDDVQNLSRIKQLLSSCRPFSMSMSYSQKASQFSPTKGSWENGRQNTACNIIEAIRDEMIARLVIKQDGDLMSEMLRMDEGALLSMAVASMCLHRMGSYCAKASVIKNRVEMEIIRDSLLPAIYPCWLDGGREVAEKDPLSFFLSEMKEGVNDHVALKDRICLLEKENEELRQKLHSTSEEDNNGKNKADFNEASGLLGVFDALSYSEKEAFLARIFSRLRPADDPKSVEAQTYRSFFGSISENLPDPDGFLENLLEDSFPKLLQELNTRQKRLMTRQIGSKKYVG